MGAGCHVLTPRAGSPPFGETPPLPPFKIGYKVTFAGSPAPTSPGPHPSPPHPSPQQPGGGGVREASSLCALRVSLFFREAGRDESPSESPASCQPPGRSSPLRGRALLPLRGASHGRQHLEFCPKKGAWRRRKGGTEAGGEQRNPESKAARGRGPERRRRRRP